jgi:hypothetical protein
MIKLSKTSKMPCRSWSLEALVTCPASKDSNGELVPACKGCYATTGMYHMPNVKKPRQDNKEDWQRDNWVSDMVDELDTDRYFRWFDSGDMYSLQLAEKILEIMKLTPWVKHWLPTRMYKFKKFTSILDTMESLDNVVIRKSSDSVLGVTIKGITTSTIVPEDMVTKHHKCPAYNNNGKCGKCRACWDKSVPVVAYVAHGNKMKKIIATSAT